MLFEQHIGGLFLGLLFGFLDNLGLFEGMSELDPVFDIYAPKLLWSSSDKTFGSEWALYAKAAKVLEEANFDGDSDMQQQLTNAKQKIASLRLGIYEEEE